MKNNLRMNLLLNTIITHYYLFEMGDDHHDN